MPYLCNSNTLRLFIRNIAQVDVLAAQHQSQRQFQKTSVRGFTPIQSLCAAASFHTGSPSYRGHEKELELDTSALDGTFVEFTPTSIDALAADVKPHVTFDERPAREGGRRSSGPAYASDTIRTPRSSRPYQEGPRSRSSEYSEDRGQRSRTSKPPYSEERAFKPRTGKPSLRGNDGRLDRTTRGSQSERKPWARDVEGSDGALKTIVRRTKAANEEFSLHFSAPRAPLPGRSSNADESRLEERSVFKPTDDLPSNIIFPGQRTSPYKETQPSESGAGLSGFKSSSIRSPRAEESNFEATRVPDQEEWTPPLREHWQIDKDIMKQKFPDGWNPRKRLSPDALAGIRALHAQMPELYTTEALAASFQQSPEAIRRILKSKWSPTSEEETDRQRRWFNRGREIYAQAAELGYKPSKKWREAGVGTEQPEWMKKKNLYLQRKQMFDDLHAQGVPKAAPPALLTTARQREEVAVSSWETEDEIL